MKTNQDTDEGFVVYCDSGLIGCNLLSDGRYLLTDGGFRCDEIREIEDWRELQMAVMRRSWLSPISEDVLQTALEEIGRIGMNHERQIAWERGSRGRSLMDAAVVVCVGGAALIGFLLWGLG